MHVQRAEEVVVVVGEHLHLQRVLQHLVDVLLRHVDDDVLDLQLVQLLEGGVVLPGADGELPHDDALVAQRRVLQDLLHAHQRLIVLVEYGEGLPVLQADQVAVGVAQRARVRIEVDGVVGGRLKLEVPPSLDVRHVEDVAGRLNVGARLNRLRPEDGRHVVVKEAANCVFSIKRVSVLKLAYGFHLKYFLFCLSF